MHELTRRSALNGLGIAVVAGVLGYVVSRNSEAASTAAAGTAANGYGYGAPSPTGSGKAPKRLAALTQVPAGGGLILPQDDIVLTRPTSAQVHGFSATCTHQGCPVASVSDGTINCPCHGSRFDVRTGAVVAGPAPTALPKVQVTVQADTVYTP
jgi:Rieske Fe-S protein